MDNKIIIQVQGFELTEAIENCVEKVAKKIFKVDSTVERVEVYLELQKRKDDNGCQATFEVQRKGKNVVVEEAGTDLYECINKAGAGAVRATRHEKEKKLEKQR